VLGRWGRNWARFDGQLLAAGSHKVGQVAWAAAGAGWAEQGRLCMCGFELKK